MLFVFFKIMIADFIAEMGDKTQLMLVGLTSKYKIHHIIIGTGLAIIILNVLAVIAGGFLNEFLKNYLWLVKLFAAAAFMYFSATSLLKGSDEEEESSSKIKFAPAAVFCTFFAAELGDKTQLTAITFGADYGLSMAAVVCTACIIGFFAADTIGLLVGYLLKTKIPTRFLNLLSFAIFAVFGMSTLVQGLYLLLAKPVKESTDLKEMIFNTPYLLPVLCLVGIIFASICLVIVFIEKRKARENIK